MSVRTLLAVGAVALLPFTAGSAHASCLDDATARDLSEGYSHSEKSQYWQSKDYAQVTGTATVTFYGDALASDATLSAGDRVEYARVASANAVDTTKDFVDCAVG